MTKKLEELFNLDDQEASKPEETAQVEKPEKDIAAHQEQYIKNQAKWEAAAAWCKQKRVRFRIVSEDDIFHKGNKRK